MKKIITILLSAMIVFCFTAFPILAANDQSEDDYTPKYRHVADYADVLSAKEEKKLNAAMEAFTKEYEFDLVVLTTMGISPYERMEIADDYYDYNDYGYGEDKDGALLLVNVNGDESYSEGNSWISTCGSGINYINDEDISTIGERLTPMLLLGDYMGAFEGFAIEVESNINSYKAGKALTMVMITLLVAFAGAFIYTRILKAQLKSVADAYEANDYVVDNSLDIDKSYDHFLYSNVVRVKIEKDNGGSSTHTSSSGRSHGGGGF